MKANKEGASFVTGRWIRPVPDVGPLHALRSSSEGDLDALAGQLLRETRRRVSGLVALERRLEDRIRGRWEEAEAEVRRRMASTDAELEAARRGLDGELKDARLKAEKAGRAAGFREGFSRGREEGYRLGFEEGRQEGQREGQREGREEEGRRLENELSGAASALARAAVELEGGKERFLADARGGVLQLAVEIARRLVKRELTCRPDTIVLNVQKAIELIFRRGAVSIHVHPEDAPIMEKALAAEPRWAEGFESVEIRAATDIERGGCRLTAGAGSVDMTLKTQLALIEAALESAEQAPPPDDAATSTATDDRLRSTESDSARQPVQGDVRTTRAAARRVRQQRKSTGKQEKRSRSRTSAGKGGGDEGGKS